MKVSKMRFRCCMICICFLILCPAVMCLAEYSRAANVSVPANKKKVEMYVGQIVRFAGKHCKWKSSDRKIVSINQKGLARAVKPGIARITINSSNRREIKVYRVVVGKYISGISVSSPKRVKLNIGQKHIISVNVKPSKALCPAMSYKSGNVSVAKINKNGIITAVGEGKTYVTVTTKGITSQKKTPEKKSAD